MQSIKPQTFQAPTGGRSPLAKAFYRWQCRVRQIAMREDSGRPNAGMIPSLQLKGEDTPMGDIITLLNKSENDGMLPELKFLVQKTHDPAERRKKALELLCERYYQQAETFSDTLTSTFTPQSEGAARILAAEECTLDFAAFGQSYRLPCTVLDLQNDDYLYQATYWHNLLFNPTLLPDIRILGFVPDWENAKEARLA